VLKPRKRGVGSNLVDMGRCAARGHRWWSTPKPVDSAGGEATLKVCGVGVAMLPGHELGTSLVDRSRGERGNRPRSLLASVGQAEAEGQVRRRLTAGGRDGGLVVVRGRESRLHGEGDQQTRRKDAGMPGVRR
jgi:hypothetical protein